MQVEPQKKPHFLIAKKIYIYETVAAHEKGIKIHGQREKD